MSAFAIGYYVVCGVLTLILVYKIGYTNGQIVEIERNIDELRRR